MVEVTTRNENGVGVMAVDAAGDTRSREISKSPSLEFLNAIDL